jgi:hypothetical protein
VFFSVAYDGQSGIQTDTIVDSSWMQCSRVSEIAILCVGQIGGKKNNNKKKEKKRRKKPSPQRQKAPHGASQHGVAKSL